METEKKSYEIAREKLDALCLELGLKLNVLSCRAESDESRGERPWIHWAWQLEICQTADNGHGRRDTKTVNTTYKTGVGLYDRKKAAALERIQHLQPGDLQRLGTIGRLTPWAQLAVADRFKACATKPTCGDILASLCRDFIGADQSFDNWAAEYGYSEDSREAEKTYFACQDGGKQLAALGLSRQHIQQIAELGNEL